MITGTSSVGPKNVKKILENYQGKSLVLVKLKCPILKLYPNMKSVMGILEYFA